MYDEAIRVLLMAIGGLLAILALVMWGSLKWLS